ncbi:MAG: sulfur oxidation c-type cytochrome SoxX [Pseudomonadota bacterium]
MAATPEQIAAGKAIAWDRKGGNCLACHSMPEGDSPGNLGPPLIAMQARFPDRQKLYDQIYDATQLNPGSRMPPFGKYHILTETEINAVLDYLYTL